MKRILCCLLCVFALAGIGFGILRIVKVNQKFPAAKEVVVPLGETMQFSENTYTVTHSEFWTKAELLERYPELIEMEKNKSVVLKEDGLILMVTVNYKGSTGPLVSSFVSSGAWGNGIHLPLYGVVNKEVEPETCIVTFEVPKEHFSETKWDALRPSDIQMVLSVYPQKSILKL